LTRTVPPVIGSVIVGFPEKFRTMLGPAKGDLKSVKVVSVVPFGLKKRVLDAVAGQLPRFVRKAPEAVVLV
jgi:hypothetical protein